MWEGGLEGSRGRGKGAILALNFCSCWVLALMGTSHRRGGGVRGSCVGRGYGAHPWGSGGRWGREYWVQVGAGREVGLGPISVRLGAGRHDAEGAGAGERLHSNELLHPAHAGGAGPRAGQGGRRPRRRITKPRSLRDRAARATLTQSGMPTPAPTLRSGPARTVGSRTLGAPRRCVAGRKTPSCALRPDSGSGAGSGAALPVRGVIS